ncbi:hypothetical protein F5Y19DRAFT_483096 [Xylariaceae sp. FL1651]|nr:hypothetical protein F5Y19DRAFT_483096 [Xylariaceae sp. FL1651]
MIFALPVHDFLLAAMIVCLDLSVRMRLRETVAEAVDYRQLRGQEYQALQVSQKIWVANSSNSPEAHVALLALELMIEKVAGENDSFLSIYMIPHKDVTQNETEFQYAGAMPQIANGSENVDRVSSRWFYRLWKLGFQ